MTPRGPVPSFDLAGLLASHGAQIAAQIAACGQAPRRKAIGLGHLTERQYRTLTSAVRAGAHSTQAQPAGGGQDRPEVSSRGGQVAEPPAPETPEVTVKSEGDRLAVSAKGQGLVRNLDELMREAEIDSAAWTAEDFAARTWATPLKKRTATEDGGIEDEVVIVRSWYVSAKFRRRLDVGISFPKWERPALRVPSEIGAGSCALIIPDLQIGYRWRDRHRRLEPLHDWAAIDASLQIAALLDPSILQWLGDSLDLAPWSTKYDVGNDLRDTTAPSALTFHALARRWLAAAPNATDANHQDGNHDCRPERALGSRAVGLEEAVGLSPADDPDGPGVASFARLVGLDALGITHQAYGEERWLWNAVRIHHGEIVRNGGGRTAASAVEKATHSQLFGHIHRQEVARRSLWGARGRREIFACSPGTLCRVDGAVPGVSQRPDWQQGVAVVWWDEGRQQEHLELVPIHNGVAFFRGQRIEGDGVRLAGEVADEIGWPQVAAIRRAA